MTPTNLLPIKRREFLKLAGAVSAFGFAHGAFAESGRKFAIIVHPDDSTPTTPPVLWAIDQLRHALIEKGESCEIFHSLEDAAATTFHIRVAGPASILAAGFPQAGVALTGAEQVRLMSARVKKVPTILVSGSDERGFIYGLLELAERVRYGANALAALHLPKLIEESPANEVRSVSRYFSSEVEDKAWYYDKDLWRGYLDLLVTSRFNRFCLAFGLEYDFPRGVTSDYLHFPYPYLVNVPGYSDVRVMQLATPEGKPLATPQPLPSEEQAKNFEMLRFIAAETAARGLDFQLGIWTHAYEWTDSPKAYHHIDGLTPETHAAYCRDALAILLKECPQIKGLTMRVHGESGIPEGSYPFWKTVFEAITKCGRTIEIDMHAKGVNTTMIDIAVATGMPVKLGAKYSAEHQSLGYNQADIRALEIPKPGHEGEGPFSLSSGARSFTRYGYADFLREGNQFKVLFRLWPGTQRHLLSADPEMAAAYARTAHLCGAAGLDLMEPLTFKGREGSGQPGGRCAYADATLTPKFDWEKFELYYRVWGRKLYNPDADAETWRQWLRTDFGAATPQIETAIAASSRILPLLTSAHLPSASNHAFWAELYTNMPIVLGNDPSPYSDTPEPRSFANVSPLDPQLFSTVPEYVNDLLAGNPHAKYSPAEVAQWMEDLVVTSNRAISDAYMTTKSRTSPEFRRMEADILIQNGLGVFFAAKLRCAVLYEIYQRTDSTRACALALGQYQRAYQGWSGVAKGGGAVYLKDIAYGRIPMRRGHWIDRLPAMDKDILAIASKLEAARKKPIGAPDFDESKGISATVVSQAIDEAVGRPVRPVIKCEHTAPAEFAPGTALALTLHLPHSGEVDSVQVHYRHVNQGERWLHAGMEATAGDYTGAIPADYTQSPYALQYYFELKSKSGAATLYPAFNSTLSNQPYFAVSKPKAPAASPQAG